MYNEELKTKFVQGYTSSINTANVCYTVFNAIEKYENEWGADISTRSVDDVQSAIDEIVGLRTRSKWMRLNILSDYARWCVSEGVPGACDSLTKIHSIGLSKIKQQTVSSPAHLEKYLNEICDPVQLKTTDNIYRCYYWLAYAGVKEEDILHIRCEDVDFDNMVVNYNGTEVPLYREAVAAFRNCVELSQFFYNHPLYSADKQVWKDRAPGDTVVRGIRAQVSVKAMRVELSRRSKAMRDDGLTALKLSYYRAWISGLFYRVYELEQMGIEPDFTTVVSKQIGDKLYKLDSGRNTQSAKRRQLVYDYIEDYNRWKLAYKK